MYYIAHLNKCSCVFFLFIISFTNIEYARISLICVSQIKSNL